MRSDSRSMDVNSVLVAEGERSAELIPSEGSPSAMLLMLSAVGVATVPSDEFHGKETD